MKKCFALAVLAGTAMTTVALAQQQDVYYVDEVTHEVRTSPVGFPGAGGYESRDILPVYDNIVGGGFFLGNCTNSLDDVGFANGPWTRPGPNHTITELTYGVYAITSDAVDEQNLVIIWDKNDVNYQGFGGAGTNMVRPGATPLQVFRVDFPPGPTAGATNMVLDLTGLPGGGFTIPATADGIYIQVAWITNGFTPSPSPATDPSPDWSNLAANASGSLWGGRGTDGLPLPPCPFLASDRSILYGSLSAAPNGGNPAVPGFSLRDYGRDIANTASPDMCPNNGQFIGNGGPAVPGGQIEHRYISSTSDAHAMRVRLMGDVQVSLPSPLQADLGCIPDTGVSSSSSVAGGGVKWYQLCVQGDVQDVFQQFLDIDTEGSSGDVSVALYATNGSVVATDDGSGSGTNDQLTFGVGIRAAVGDGLQYNGRSGQFLAGTYYLAVAPSGSAFDFGFAVTAAPGGGGAFRVNVATNTNGSPLAPSVAPASVDVGDVSNGAESSSQDIGVRGVVWYKFETTFDTATTLDHWVDITLDGPGHNAAGDPHAHLFDASGNLVAMDDDSGTGTLSQFSFSHSVIDGGPADRPASGDGLPLAGQNGDLAAGVYYIGIGTYEVTSLASGSRWHLRGTNTATTTTALRFVTGAPTCPPCAADFNLDGGVDGGDIETFFTAWEAGDTCGDTNLDGGVDGGDIEAFFSVWEAGGC
jgi:hypothetical protein